MTKDALKMYHCQCSTLGKNDKYLLTDCPNGFYHLNNRCYRWLPPDDLSTQLKSCHLFRGRLLEVSPKNPISELIAKKLMSSYSSDKLHAGQFDK